MKEKEPSRFLNRELSWLRFNERVLSEASNPRNPLLERAKFLSIFESNYDEFFMIRVSGFIEQIEGNIAEQTPDGLTPKEQVEEIMQFMKPLRDRASAIWADELRPLLEQHKITIKRFDDLSAKPKRRLSKFFKEAVFPVCTPLLLDQATNFPFISSRSLNLVIRLRDELGDRYARVKIPLVIPRLIRISSKRNSFVTIEDLIASHLVLLFPGVEIVEAHLFRVIRDADIELRELEASDLLTSVEMSLHQRRFGDPVLLEVGDAMSVECRAVLQRGLGLPDEYVLKVNGMLGLESLGELMDIEKPKLKYPNHRPSTSGPLYRGADAFKEIRQSDVLVHLPYDSFRAVQNFVHSAATDPKVLGIKVTLYRVGEQSAIVESLLKAAQAGKQVAAMVELKARFDESNNLEWSRTLERAGVHVTYGFAETKTHCKLALIVRKEHTAIRSYAYIGTGNFNPQTARFYTDLGLFTSNPDICQDVSELFNYLTGYSKQDSYRKLLVAPNRLRDQIIAQIRKEVKLHREFGEGWLKFKLNSLVDPEVIDALYEASNAGVNIDLLVRGICCLRPGVPGQSENIRVRSIVGRFLEHSRAYCFGNNGEPIVYIGSADMMRRNLDRRVETLAPVTKSEHIQYILDNVISLGFKDNVQAWNLGSDGNYERVQRRESEEEFEYQVALMARPAGKIKLS